MHESGEVGLYLRRKRMAVGLTQVDVAERFGYANSQFISNIERGISAPPVAIMKRLIQYYKIPKQEFIQLLADEHKKAYMKILG